MQINFYSLRGVQKELKKLNHLFELYLTEVHGINVAKNHSDEGIQVSYLNDEEEAMREFLAAEGKSPDEIERLIKSV